MEEVRLREVRRQEARSVAGELEAPGKIPGDLADGDAPDQRLRLFTYVRANPGAPVGKIGPALGIGWGTVYYHLCRLQRSGSVRIVHAGRRRLVYATADAQAHTMAPADAVLGGRTTRVVAGAIIRHAGAS